MQVHINENTTFEAKLLDGSKIHAITKDDVSKLKAGTNVGILMGKSKKEVHQVKAVSIQGLEIVETGESSVDVLIDGKKTSYDKLSEIAIGEGYGDVHELLAAFKPPFKGSIVHWTERKY